MSVRLEVLSSHKRELTSTWHRVICFAVEYTTGFFLVNATPLFEEERYFLSSTLFPNTADPFLIHRSRSWTRFSTYNHPVNAM